MIRILLITDILPTKKHTAGIVLEQTLRHFDRSVDLLTYAVISDGLQTYPVSEYVSGKMRWARKPQENWNINRRLTTLLEKVSARDTDKISKDILKQISRQSPDLILLVLQGQTMYRIAKFLGDRGIIFSTFNWDPLSWWLENHSVSKSLGSLLTELKPILRARGHHFVPTQQFSQYLGLDGSNFSILNLAQDKFYRNKSIPSNTFKIVFSGQTYASKEIDFVIRKLEQSNWKLGEKLIEFHIYGRNSWASTNNIFVHGWVEPNQLCSELSKYDCALLPYPSENKFEETAKHSYPSKFSTYLSSDLPILFVGGDNHPFTEDDLRFIEVCNINESESFDRALENILSEKILQSVHRENYFAQKFSVQSQSAVVAKFLSYMNLEVVASASTEGMIRNQKLRNSRDGEQFIYRVNSIHLGNFILQIKRTTSSPKYFARKLFIFLKNISGKWRSILGFIYGQLFSRFRILIRRIQK